MHLFTREVNDFFYDLAFPRGTVSEHLTEYNFVLLIPGSYLSVSKQVG